MVYPMNDIPALDGKNFLQGFAIFQEVDLHYLLTTDKQPYKAQIWTNSSILFTMPGFHYTMLYDCDGIKASLEDYILNVIDDGLYKFKTSKCREERLKKNILLVFPNFVKLSMKEINEEPEEGDENGEALNLKANKVTNKTIDGFGQPHVRHFLVWEVCQVDVKAKKRGKTDVMKKSKLHNLFGVGVPPSTPSSTAQSAAGSTQTPNQTTSGGVPYPYKTTSSGVPYPNQTTSGNGTVPMQTTSTP